MLIISRDAVPKMLESETAHKASDEVRAKTSYINDEAKFRWALFEDQMAFDKLHEGIRGFAKDGELLLSHSGQHVKTFMLRPHFPTPPIRVNCRTSLMRL